MIKWLAAKRYSFIESTALCSASMFLAEAKLFEALVTVAICAIMSEAIKLEGKAMKDMIDVTGIDLALAVQVAYSLSKVAGLGHLHFRPGELSYEEAATFVYEEDDRYPVNLDYVHGRSCKFHIIRRGEQLFIPDHWYDHTDDDLKDFLKRCGIKQ